MIPLNQTLAPLGPSFPLSVLTRLADPVRHRLMPLDADRARVWAERLNGLHDFGGNAVLDRLEATVESLQKVDWNALGHFGIRYILNWHLGNRLRLVELFKQHPELEDTAIRKPIVITGLFRTGTTFLHNVLAADPANRVGRTWELAHPVGRPRDLLGDVEWRRWRGSHEVAMNYSMIPDQDQVHYVEADAYEEDFFLLENDLAVLELAVGLGDFGYGMRMLDWDMREAYEWHKRQLQLLWFHESAERWLLKCPWHLWNLEAFLSVYPDALIIQMHRSLPETIGSQCSLSARTASKFQRSLDLRRVGRFWLEYSRVGVERGFKAREAFPNARVHDVRLADLLSAPLQTVREIYEVFDLPIRHGLLDSFAERIAAQRVAQRGAHEYGIGDYGLTASEIESDFADYRATFDL